ncbi:MAG: hypothetical protein ACOYCA_02060 [Eggerthellaceae bacterium]
MDLSAVGGSPYLGNVRYSFTKILNNDGLTIIDQSVTGMFETRTVLSHLKE